MRAVGKRQTDPGYGQGQVTLDLSDDVLLDEEALTQRLIETLASPAYRPPTLPSVATEILALAQNPDAELHDIVALLEQDTMLTAQVLKLVRSPIYAGTAQVRSLSDAVVRIGLNALRDVVLEVAMTLRVFRAPAYASTMERVRQHSIYVAHLARRVCRYTAIEGEYAFLCGLLHDVGVAGVLIALSEGRSGASPDLISIWPALDRAHAEAGTRMAALWNLPEEVQMVIGAHHQVLIGGYPHPLAATVCLADALLHERKLGLVADDAGGSDRSAACLASHTEIDRSSERTLATACEALALTERQLTLVRDELDDVLDSANG